MNRLLFGAILFFTSFLGFSQGSDLDGESVFLRSNYDWKKERVQYTLSSEDSLLPSIVLKYHRAFEYTYDNKDLAALQIVHVIAKVNTPDAVQQFNRIYLPKDNVIDLVRFKARVIKKNNSVLMQDQDQLLDMKGEDGISFKGMAISGIELGSEIEYMYVQKIYPTLFDREFMQLQIPIRNASFELISPSNLVFEAKGYNGFPVPAAMVENERQILYAELASIPKSVVEPYSYLTSNQMRVEWKLTYNSLNGFDKILTWEDASENLGKAFFTITESEQKLLDKEIKHLKLKKLKSDLEKIKGIESYVKSKIVFQKGIGKDFEEIEKVLKNNFANEKGFTKLMLALLSQVKIYPQLVLTTNRTEIKFDESFESWSFLDHYLLYFSGLEKLLIPYNPFFRLGSVPFQFTNNNALFIPNRLDKKQSEMESKIKFIAPPSYSENTDSLSLILNFDLSKKEVKAAVKREMKGYFASNIQPYYAIVNEDQKKNIVETLMKFLAEDALINKYEVKNGNLDGIKNNKPFVVEGEVTVKSLIEKAGNKYLIKIGQAIGPQVELYQEKERVYDIENDFNRVYKRRVELAIPKNYIIKNPEDLIFSTIYEEDKSKIFGFESSYIYENNKLILTINEYYKKLEFPKEKFDEFRRVINAAANFNKVTLVLEKVAN